MDVQLTAQRSQRLRDLEQTVSQVAGLIERARRANFPPESIARLQEQLDTAEAQRRGLLAEFGTGGKSQPHNR
jgi:hypothetical protein